MNIKKFSDSFLKDKKISIIVLIGFIGIMLIFLSQFSFFGTVKNKKKADVNTVASDSSLVSYTLELEDKIHTLVTSIEGVGDAKVMVTFESDAEYVYVNQEKKNTDKTEDVNGNSTKKIQDKQNIEQSLIIVEDENGERALLKTKIEPKVKGVVVVCAGGNSPDVQQRVSEALTTALDIEYNKVCVTKLT